MTNRRTKTKLRSDNSYGGDFYKGIEWFACWMLDNVEGETITEELLRPWAAEAWYEHLKRLPKGIGNVAKVNE
jgi:hypothetical protein